VNTPRSDEDRLKLMELMVFMLKKGVCDEFELNAARLSKFLLSGKYAAGGFEQIIDFLNGSYINHALTMNPHVYISCIKQFWNTSVVKRSGQRFNFSKYIFESLVRNVDSTSKFYMYPRVRKGFSGVKTPLFENMLTVRAVDVEEEVQVPAQDDVVQEHVIEEIATEVVQPTPTSLSPSSPVIPSTHPHQSPSPPQPQTVEGSSHLVQQVLDKCSALVLRVEGLETANAAQQLEIIKLKARVAAASVPIPAAKPAAKPKVLKIVAAPDVSTRKRKGVVIRDPEEELHIDTPKMMMMCLLTIPLAQKAPVVDYQVVVIDNRPKYKIIRADDTHQLYISFTTLLKNFDRKDLEALWRIVKDRFSTKKPTNFLDEYLLLTLKTMFRELSEQDAIWRNQKSVHGLSLVKRWKLLTSCELMLLRRLEKNTKCVSAANEELTAAKHKLMLLI
nr:hypothetical protein [Tanacetum cinerariifolium]